MVDVLRRLKEGVHGGCTYERPKKRETGKDVFMRAEGRRTLRKCTLERRQE
jgi:hypothetical protein